eukprot:GHVQ01041797.1.p1 GENE.GHVQ01041797.1~~GHVQ01041797.1.p1  ORF type:complete len:270 (+),score=24.14 GHVQ01041797.1:91-900(+)
MCCITGDPRVCVSMFSFGLIKTNTALAGAILNVRDSVLADDMRRIQSSYREQSLLTYMWKMTVGLGACVFQTWGFLFCLTLLGRLTSVDYHPYLISLLRGFRPSQDTVNKYRFRMRRGALRVLRYRLASWDQSCFEMQMDRLNRFSQHLMNLGIVVPGMGKERVKRSCYWLYPIQSFKGHTPVETCKRLKEFGVEAGCKSTQLTVITAPTDEGYVGKYSEPMSAIDMMRNIIYLPVHRRANPALLDKIIDAVRIVHGSNSTHTHTRRSE